MFCLIGVRLLDLDLTGDVSCVCLRLVCCLFIGLYVFGCVIFIVLCLCLLCPLDAFVCDVGLMWLVCFLGGLGHVTCRLCLYLIGPWF